MSTIPQRIGDVMFRLAVTAVSKAKAADPLLKHLRNKISFRRKCFLIRQSAYWLQ
jgi:hypothetical protein